MNYGNLLYNKRKLSCSFFFFESVDIVYCRCVLFYNLLFFIAFIRFCVISFIHEHVLNIFVVIVWKIVQKREQFPYEMFFLFFSWFGGICSPPIPIPIPGVSQGSLLGETYRNKKVQWLFMMFMKTIEKFTNLIIMVNVYSYIW